MAIELFRLPGTKISMGKADVAMQMWQCSCGHGTAIVLACDFIIPSCGNADTAAHRSDSGDMLLKLERDPSECFQTADGSPCMLPWALGFAADAADSMRTS